MTKLKLSSSWKKEEKTREIRDETPIVKYLTSQVSNNHSSVSACVWGGWWCSGLTTCHHTSQNQVSWV